MPYTTGTVPQFHNSGGGSVKGFLQTLLDYCCGTKYTQNVGTGDGTEKEFSWTITNTPPAKGNVLLKFRKGSVWYEIWDDGTSWDYHEHVTDSSINYATGECEATIQADNATSVDLTYCVGQNSGEEGRDWLIMIERNTKTNNDVDAFPGQELKEVVLKNSGDSYKESIFVGFRETKYAPSNFYNINLNVCDIFDPSITVKTWFQNYIRTGNTGYSATYNNWAYLPSIPLNDDTLPYWFYCSKNKIFAAGRPTTGVYTSLYAGAGKRFEAPSRYRNPLCAIGTIHGDNNFSSTGDLNVFPIGILSGQRAGMMLDKDNNYVNTYDNMRFIPKNYWNGTYIYTTIGKTTNNKVMRHPVVVYDQAKDYPSFELEGLFWCPCNSLASEDTFTVDGDTFDVFQNVYRTTYLDYMCVKRE